MIVQIILEVKASLMAAESKNIDRGVVDFISNRCCATKVSYQWRLNMPPKPSVSREDIIQTAFTIFQNEGMPSLNARNVAGKLGLSTKPIYFYFASMVDLRKEVMQKVKGLMLTYTSKKYTDSIFLNIGTGLVAFARDHKKLFRLMFLENNEFKEIVEGMLVSIRQDMKKDTQLKNMSQKERDALMNNMWMFSHGLASMICVGLIDKDSDDFIIDTLTKTGSVVTHDAVKKSQKNKTSR
jgi:AcrR family transcriptional regulator